MPPKPIPDAYRAAIPYLSISGAAKAIDFYKAAFGAIETERMADPAGHVMHAEIRIGDAPIMLADEYPDLNFRSPLSLGGTPVIVHVYVEDVDAFTARAVAEGAKMLRPPKDEFYGDRSATLVDPFGHMWGFATRIEDIDREEMQRRMAAMAQQHASS